MEYMIFFFEGKQEGFYHLLCFIAKKVQKGSTIQNEETKKLTKKIERITHKLLALNRMI